MKQSSSSAWGPTCALAVIVLLFLSCSGPLAGSPTEPAESRAVAALVSVNAASLLQSGTAGGARLGINTDYWWDDQANRTAGAVSLSTAVKNLGVKYLRYPGGEKADGYLWSVPPFTAPNPRLARISSSDWPSNDSAYWSPTGSPTGTWSHAIYDFDEFMADCIAAGAQPIIVVAYDGIYKSPLAGGTSLTRQQALDTAAAWVHYANNVKHYGIKYWEIGNETYLNQPGSHDYMGIDPGRTTQANDFIAFSTVMKAQDPTILCGINTDTQSDFSTLLSVAHSQIDFFDIHAYEAWPFADYAAYAAGNLNQNAKVDAAWNALAAYPADQSRIKLLVAETGAITYGYAGSWTAADTGHALMNFETMAMLMQDPRVTATAFWNTHWMEQTKTNQWPNYLESEYDALKPDNSLSPQGWGIKLLSNYALDQMLGTTSSGKVRVYATKNSGRLNVWLVNKDTVSTVTSLTLQNFNAAASGSKSVYKGTGSADMYPVFTANAGTVAVSSNSLTLNLDPVSITIVQLTAVPIVTNRLANPGFESGATTPWVVSNSNIISGNAHAGRYSLATTGSSRGFWYLVTGLSPNTTYTFRGWLKAGAPGQKAYLFAKDHGAAQVSSPVSTATSFGQASLTFTTGPSASSATVGLWRDSGSGTGTVYTDDFELF